MSFPNRDAYKASKERFWQFLIDTIYFPGVHTNSASVLVEAIDIAFTNTSSTPSQMPVSREMIQYLAGYTDQLLKGTAKGDVVGHNENHFLKRTFDGFFQTICVALKEERTHECDNGDVTFGCLVLPKWLVQECAEQVKEQAFELAKVRAL